MLASIKKTKTKNKTNNVTKYNSSSALAGMEKFYQGVQQLSVSCLEKRWLTALKIRPNKHDVNKKRKLLYISGAIFEPPNVTCCFPLSVLTSVGLAKYIFQTLRKGLIEKTYRYNH